MGEHYRGIFEPLILEECCSGIVRGSVEGETPECHQAIIASRRSVGTQLPSSFPSVMPQEGEWLNVRITLRAGISAEFRKGDLIILSRDHPDEAEAQTMFHAMGLVESKEGEQSIGVRFYLNLASQAGSTHQEHRIRAMDEAVVQGSPWWVCRLDSLSTIVREWIAVQHVHRLPFKDLLMTATPMVLPEDHWMLPPTMASKISASYNPSQVEAVPCQVDHLQQNCSIRWRHCMLDWMDRHWC